MIICLAARIGCIGGRKAAEGWLQQAIAHHEDRSPGKPELLHDTEHKSLLLSQMQTDTTAADLFDSLAEVCFVCNSRHRTVSNRSGIWLISSFFCIGQLLMELCADRNVTN